jgi:hypothetical protein
MVTSRFADLSEDEMEEILNETKNNLLACRDKPVKLKTGKEIKIESIKYDKVSGQQIGPGPIDRKLLTVNISMIQGFLDFFKNSKNFDFYS